MHIPGVSNTPHTAEGLSSATPNILLNVYTVQKPAIRSASSSPSLGGGMYINESACTPMGAGCAALADRILCIPLEVARKVAAPH